jgi:biopolymer transport protein ExbD
MGLLTTAFLATNLALHPASLPQSAKSPVNKPSSPITLTPMVVVVTIDDQGKTFINRSAINHEQLWPAIIRLHNQETEAVFLINPSDKASLLDVSKIMTMMQSEGIEIALVSKPRSYPHPVKGFDNLPKSNPKLNMGKAPTSESLVVGIDEVGRTLINENSLEPSELSLAIKQQYDQKPETTFLIIATPKTLYGDAAHVIDVMRSVGVKSTTLNIVLPGNQPNIVLPVNLGQSSRFRQMESLESPPREPLQPVELFPLPVKP